MNLWNMYKFKPISITLLLLIQALLCPDISSSADLEYFVPLGNERITDYNKLSNRIIGKYGDNRNSIVQGHKHSGIDIQGNGSETVYPISIGIVTNIFRAFPHKTIYIRHNDIKGSPFYSVYIHVEDIQVNVGDLVEANTPIARIFNREELESSKFGTPPHLHFEIRHSITDKGDATFKSMSTSELDRYCIDPVMFFKKTLVELTSERQ